MLQIHLFAKYIRLEFHKKLHFAKVKHFMLSSALGDRGGQRLIVKCIWSAKVRSTLTCIVCTSLVIVILEKQHKCRAFPKTF